MRNIFITTFTLVPLWLCATDLQISEVHLNETDSTIRTKISWSNAWQNDKNHDAIWLFYKARSEREIRHLPCSGMKLNITESTTPLTIEIPSDSMGLFIYATNDYRGDIETMIELKPNPEIWEKLYEQDGVNGYGIEMVYIPEGPFILGEPGTAYLDYGGLYVSDNDGNPGGLYEVTSEENEIKIGPHEGQLYYQTKTRYEGDQKGVLPPVYPKGFRAFYIMKYEPTQGQYVDFLNTLSEQQSQMRANFGGKYYYERRGSIRIEDNVYTADEPGRPCNFMSWDDAMAYADWAGLRPMTELEFVKAARGPGKPTKNEYPWNTASYSNLKRVMTETGDLEKPDEGDLYDNNRDVYGASYYWVMDLAGSMWERVVSIGNEKGRSFYGSHGDGRLSGYGFANIDNWPSGIDGPGGFGFRGGGYYVYPMEFTEFNPYSPIAYRRFGGWSGGNRTEAYGARFVRTSD